MTPKEKAEELYIKFHYQICTDNGLMENDSNIFSAIQCALIAVDEILNGFRKILPSSRDYWEEVKKELSNL